MVKLLFNSTKISGQKSAIWNDEKIMKRVYNNSSIPQQNRLRPEWQGRPDLKRDEVRRK